MSSQEQALDLMAIFKLLTPKEVSRLTETASRKSSNSVSAVDFVEASLNSEGVVDVSRITKSAKIIPIEKSTKQITEDVLHEVVDEFDEKYDVGQNFEDQSIAENVVSLKTKKSVTPVSSGSSALKTDDTDFEVDIDLSKEEQQLEAVGIVSNYKAAKIDKLRKEKELRDLPSASVFLISEREKVKVSQRKLHNQKAINMYNTAARADLSKDLEDDDEEGEKSRGSSGILLNKRQY